MTAARSLHGLLAASAARFPDRIAVEETDGRAVTYAELAALSRRVSARLGTIGVTRGDRVGIYLHKSLDAVAALFGILEAGAAYVPIDPSSPSWRAAYILTDCEVRAAFVERAVLEGLEAELARVDQRSPSSLLVLDEVGGGAGLRALLESRDPMVEPDRATTNVPVLDDLAYLLYTSGSTGKPKGVMLSHRAALGFVDWCSETFHPDETDCFSSHAPLHFDLSILDVFVALKHGARLVLIGEELGKDPHALAPLIAAKRITVWYSTPSILNLLNQYGGLGREELGGLRLVLFAGEVFPIPQLRALKAAVPAPRYFNLYGPTETNVCTFFEVPDGPVPAERAEPFPIGRACSHYRTRVVDENGRDVPRGAEGELVCAGPSVMSGYWDLPDRNASAFLVDGSGTRWYRTGDLVVECDDGILLFHGRRDRMVKRRGFRIELGEIEAGLATHDAVGDVAVVAVADQLSGVRITAFLTVKTQPRPSVIELKGFCARYLPKYMSPDVFRFVPSLPRTPTDKTDYQTLKDLALIESSRWSSLE